MLANPEKTKVQTISATEAKNRFGTLIRNVYTTREPVIVVRNGFPVVSIVPINQPDVPVRRQVSNEMRTKKKI